MLPPPCCERMSLSKYLPAENLKGTPSRTPASYPSGTLWPTGEWSLGFSREQSDSTEWHENPLQVSQRALDHISDDWALARFPLDLSDAPNSHKRPPRGLKGITGYGRNMVKSFGALVNRDFPHHRTTLCTLTLPVLPREQRSQVVREWPSLTRQLLQWLNRRLGQLEVPQVVCSVSEVQPKRLTSHGQGYLHWHLLWLNIPARSGSWSICPNELREWLATALARVLQCSSVGHVNVDVKAVKGEVARYMAKYMSKGSEELREAQGDWGEDVTPSTWWNMTATAREWVKSNTFKGRAVGSLLDSVLQNCWDTSDLSCMAFIRQVELMLDGALVTVGWRGRFEPVTLEHLTGVLNSADIR